MKKQIIILCIILVLVLVIPIPVGTYKDGGTKRYTALTYSIVDWNRLCDDGTIYDEVKIYFCPRNFYSLDELFELEIDR